MVARRPVQPGGGAGPVRRQLRALGLQRRAALRAVHVGRLRRQRQPLRLRGRLPAALRPARQAHT